MIKKRIKTQIDSKAELLGERSKSSSSRTKKSTDKQSPSTSNKQPSTGRNFHHCPRCKKEEETNSDKCSNCGFSFSETRLYPGNSDTDSSEARSVNQEASIGTELQILSETEKESTFDPDILIGRVIGGKYRVLDVLGEGGFGVVYKVEFLLFDEQNTFALKVLHPKLTSNENFRRRFLREARLAMSLAHENAIQVREFGQTKDGLLYFTMDFCEGESLKNLLARESFISVQRALSIARQILTAIKVAHDKGIVHRDLKPENIFVERDPRGRDRVKVGDFGLAKSIQVKKRELSKDITRGGIVGSPRYMSPEQSTGSLLDERTDLFSMGIILYEMIFGTVPQEEQLDSGRGKLLSAPETSHQVVPPEVFNILRKALAKKCDQRFSTAEEFIEALDCLPQHTPMYDLSKKRSFASAVLRSFLMGLLLLVILSFVVFFNPPLRKSLKLDNFVVVERVSRWLSGEEISGQSTSQGNSRISTSQSNSDIHDEETGSPSNGIKEERNVTVSSAKYTKKPMERNGPSEGSSARVDLSLARKAHLNEGEALTNKFSYSESPNSGEIFQSLLSSMPQKAEKINGVAHEKPIPPEVKPRSVIVEKIPLPQIQDYFPLKSGQKFKYRVTIPGRQPSQEILHLVVEDGGIENRFLISTEPDQHSFFWTLDPDNNSITQEFLFPDRETGELKARKSRMLLNLPEESVQGIQVQGIRGATHQFHTEVNGYKVNVLVDLVQKTINIEDKVFERCIKVTEKDPTSDRKIIRYYQKGAGEVGREIFINKEGVESKIYSRVLLKKV